MKKKGAGAPGARKRAAAAGGDSDESDSGEAQQRARAREPVYLAPQEWPARDDLRTTAVTTTDAERARLSFAIELLDAFREDTVAELRRRGTGRAGDRPAGFLRWEPNIVWPYALTDRSLVDMLRDKMKQKGVKLPEAEEDDELDLELRDSRAGEGALGGGQAKDADAESGAARKRGRITDSTKGEASSESDDSLQNQASSVSEGDYGANYGGDDDD